MSGFCELYAIRYGTLSTSRSRFYFDFASYGEPDAEMVMDYFFYVVRSAGETVLIDCGFDARVARRRGRTPLVDPLVGLSELGVDVADVSRIVITHFHYDHVGNLCLFPNALLVTQMDEAGFWAGDVAKRLRFSASTEAGELAAIVEAGAHSRLELVAGSADIAPGLSMELVGGHTPGQSILRVATASGEVVLASDALHCYEEMELDRPFVTFADLAGTYRAFDRLRELESSGATIIAGHDPLVTDRYRPSGMTGEPVVLRLG
jgi:glyoxylase-like metal-dependent hydrolase (beta-lactamase superfamily II)